MEKGKTPGKATDSIKGNRSRSTKVTTATVTSIVTTTTAITTATEPVASTTTVTMHNSPIATPATTYASVVNPQAGQSTSFGQTPTNTSVNTDEEDVIRVNSDEGDAGNDKAGANNDDLDRPQPASYFEVWGRQFNAYQRTIKRIHTFAQSDRLDTASLQMVKNRKEELEKEWTAIHELFYTLIGQASDELAQAYDEAIEVLEEIYYEAHATMSEKISSLEEKVVSESRSASEAGQEDRPIKLIMPVQQHNMQNTWGKFDGGLRKWIGFRDRFKAAIHENSDIKDAYKLSYLLQSLTGPAAQALGKSDNYAQAWERLFELYDKPYLIAQEHLRDFYRLPALQTPASAQELERMSNVTHEVIRQLQSLDYPVEHWDFVFVHGLHDRLDTKTARDWALNNNKNNPPVSDILKFLDREATASQHTRAERREITIVKDNSPKAGPSNSTLSRKEIGKTGAIPKQFRCEACPEYHQLYDCPNFNSLNFNARKDFMERRRICENCLKKGHTKDKCFDERRCKFTQCQDDPKHNSLLCPFKIKTASVNVVKKKD